MILQGSQPGGLPPPGMASPMMAQPQQPWQPQVGGSAAPLGAPPTTPMQGAPVPTMVQNPGAPAPPPNLSNAQQAGSGPQLPFSPSGMPPAGWQGDLAGALAHAQSSPIGGMPPPRPDFGDARGDGGMMGGGLMGMNGSAPPQGLANALANYRPAGPGFAQSGQPFTPPTQPTFPAQPPQVGPMNG